LDKTRADTLKGENADRISADAEIRRMAEAHHAAIAHDEIEADRRQRKNHDAGEQRQHEDIAAELGIERQQQQPGNHQHRDGVAGVEGSAHRLPAGNSPSGRTTSTIAITR
jgi:hypothetical protein